MPCEPPVTITVFCVFAVSGHIMLVPVGGGACRDDVQASIRRSSPPRWWNSPWLNREGECRRSEQLRGQVDRGSRQGLGHRAIPLRLERIPLEGLVVEAGNFRRRLQVDPADGERVA